MVFAHKRMKVGPLHTDPLRRMRYIAAAGFQGVDEEGLFRLTEYLLQQMLFYSLELGIGFRYRIFSPRAGIMQMVEKIH